MSEAWNSILFYQNPIPMFIYSSETLDIFEVNEAAVKKYGYSRDELCNMKVKDIRIEEEYETLMTSLPIRKSGYEETKLARHRSKAGNLMYVRITSQPIDFKNEKALLSSIVDITDIQKNKEQLLFHINNSQLGWIEWDSNLSIVNWSDRTSEIFGWKKEEVFGKTPHDFKLVSQDDYDIIQEEIQDIFNRNEPRSTIELSIYDKGGAIIHTIWHNSVLLDDNNNLISVLSQIQDITIQKQTERQLHLLTTAVEAADNGIVITNINGNIIWVNPAFTKLTGYTFEEVLGQNPRILRSGEQPREFYHNLWSTIKAGQVWNGILINRRKDGSTYKEEQTITPVYSDDHKITHFIAIKRDVTEREKSEERIHKSLKEKETLLAEIHHRVKNNLAVICSLLELQTLNAPGDNTEHVLRDSQMRIKTIALIHEKLYHFERLAEIEFNHYIADLVETISKTISANMNSIKTILELENVQLNISQAMPAALILNELITNTYKHAFTNKRSGQLNIRLYEQPNNTVVIKVHDDGIGLPEHFDINQNHSLGMTIIQRLTKQLDADLNIKSDNGTCFTISFKKPLNEKEIVSSFT